MSLLTSPTRLYWIPPDVEYREVNGWPSNWGSINGYIQKVLQRLPSTDTPSPDGKRYLDQVYTLVGKLLSNQGYGETTINGNANWKDHVYGHPAYDVRPLINIRSPLRLTNGVTSSLVECVVVP